MISATPAPGTTPVSKAVGCGAASCTTLVAIAMALVLLPLAGRNGLSLTVWGADVVLPTLTLRPPGMTVVPDWLLTAMEPPATNMVTLPPSS